MIRIDPIDNEIMWKLQSKLGYAAKSDWYLSGYVICLDVGVMLLKTQQVQKGLYML